MAGDVKNQPELDKPMIKDDKPEDKENGMTPTEVSINGDDSMEVETPIVLENDKTHIETQDQTKPSAEKRENMDDKLIKGSSELQTATEQSVATGDSSIKSSGEPRITTEQSTATENSRTDLIDATSDMSDKGDSRERDVQNGSGVQRGGGVRRGDVTHSAVVRRSPDYYERGAGREPSRGETGPSQEPMGEYSKAALGELNAQFQTLTLFRYDTTHNFELSQEEISILLFDKLSLPVDKVIGFDTSNDRRPVIKYKNGFDFKPYLTKESLHIRSGLRLEPMSRADATIFIRLERIPLSVSDAEVKEAMSCFGVIIGAIQTARYSKIGNDLADRMYGKLKCERSFMFNPEKYPPSYVVIKGHKVFCKYVSQVPTCARCHRTSEGGCLGQGKAKECKLNGGTERNIFASWNDIVSEARVCELNNELETNVNAVEVSGFTREDGWSDEKIVRWFECNLQKGNWITLPILKDSSVYDNPPIFRLKDLSKDRMTDILQCDGYRFSDTGMRRIRVKPWCEARVVTNPETGPNGKRYKKDENGKVVLKDDGSPEFEDEDEQQPKPEETANGTENAKTDPKGPKKDDGAGGGASAGASEESPEGPEAAKGPDDPKEDNPKDGDTNKGNNKQSQNSTGEGGETVAVEAGEESSSTNQLEASGEVMAVHESDPTKDTEGIEIWQQVQQEFTEMTKETPMNNGSRVMLTDSLTKLSERKIVTTSLRELQGKESSADQATQRNIETRASAIEMSEEEKEFCEAQASWHLAEVFTPSICRGSTKRQMTPSSDSSPEASQKEAAASQVRSEGAVTNLTRRQKKRRRTNARVASYKEKARKEGMVSPGKPTDIQQEDVVGNEEDGLPSAAVRLSWTEEEAPKADNEEKKINPEVQKKVNEDTNKSISKRKKKAPLGHDQQGALHKMKWLLSDLKSGENGSKDQ